MNYVYAYGYLSLSNSVINITDSTTTYIYFYGTSSARGTRITVDNTATAYIYCYGADSCNDVTSVECVDGGNDCSYSFQCSISGPRTEYCDSSTYYSIFDKDTTLPDIEDSIVDVSDFDNSVFICNNSEIANYTFFYCNTYYSGGDDICSDSIISSDADPICCGGSYGCITPNILETSGEGSNGIIRCDGENSCTNTNEIRALNGADLFFTGNNAATYVNISTTDEYNVYCTAYYSCGYSLLMNINNLYCNGDDSCYNAELILNVNNVYIYGNNGAYSASLHN